MACREGYGNYQKKIKSSTYYISGRINVATERLSRLEMSRDYHLKEELFQMIQWKWKYKPVHIKIKQASKKLCE
jgi:hypothetical protein